VGGHLPGNLEEKFDSEMQVKRSNEKGVLPRHAIIRSADTEIYVMSRHGDDGRGNPLYSPAEMIRENIYEAIIWELAVHHDVGRVYGFSRVGAVDNLPLVGENGLVVPSQYVRGFAASQHSFGKDAKTVHTPMSEPFDRWLREELVSIGTQVGGSVVDDATYFCNGGDTFETPSEIEIIRHMDYLKNKVVG